MEDDVMSACRWCTGSISVTSVYLKELHSCITLPQHTFDRESLDDCLCNTLIELMVRTISLHV